MELLTVTLATFTMMMFVLGLMPFRVSPKLMPLAVSAAGYGCMLLYARWPHEIAAVAVAGGVAIVSRYAVSQLPDPWSLDDLLGRLIEMVPQRRPKRVAAAHRHRVPRL
jgi:hypothetical protein